MTAPAAANLSTAILLAVSARIEESLGLHFSAERLADLERGLERARGELGMASAQTCAEAILAGDLSPSQRDTLVGSLTIGETYFLRDPNVFALLEHDLLPELIARRRTGVPYLRLWSAGCCTGEEPYSLAILLDRLLPDRRDWNIVILATDINPAFLQRARRGVYSPWAFRGAPEWLERDFFKQSGPNRAELRADIRAMVTFAGLNLVEDTYPCVATNTNAMDIIFCRNVLMYFTPARARAVAARLRTALNPDGALFVGAAEASHELLQGLTLTSSHGAVFYRRTDTGSNAAGPPAPSYGATKRMPAASATLKPSRSAVRGVVRYPFVVPGSAGRPPEGASPDLGNSPFSCQSEPRRDRSATDQLLSSGFGAASRPPYSPPSTPEPRAPETEPSPPSTDPLARARECADAGALQAALDWSDQAVLADKTALQSHLLRAGILQELGRDAEALAALEQCLYLDANHVLACFLSGHLAAKQRKAAVAARYFTAAGRLLERRQDDEAIEDADGMSAGQLKRMLRAVRPAETEK